MEVSGAARPGTSGRLPEPGLRALLARRDFRALWAAELLSVAGDQVARVALTVLVLDRTGSIAGSAAVYALTFLPALLGGLLLGHLADRFPRRAVLVATDLVRAGLVVLMALPGSSLALVFALLVPAVLLGGPHAAARSALLPDLLPDGLLARGIAVRQVSSQLAQVAGFGGGGLLVAVATPSGALLLDATTFAGSALIVALGVRARSALRPAGRSGNAPSAGAAPSAGVGRSDGLPPAVVHPAVVPGVVTPGVPGVTGVAGAPARSRCSRLLPGDPRAALAVVLCHPRRRYLVAAGWLCGLYVLPEALAAAYAAAIGVGPAETGLLMAADPAGSVLGAAVFAFAVPARYRERWIVPTAIGAAVPLALTPLAPGLWQAVVLWASSGACATACLIQAQSGFARATPSAVRGSATGVAVSGLVASQGVAVLLGGLLAQWTAPATALGIAGIAGVALALGLYLLGGDGDGPAAVPGVAG